MLDFLIAFIVPLLTFAAGIGLQAWRTSKRTGQTMRVVILGGGPNQPEGPV